MIIKCSGWSFFLKTAKSPSLIINDRRVKSLNYCLYEITFVKPMNTCDITFYPNKESNLEDWGLTLVAYKMGIDEKGRP